MHTEETRSDRTNKQTFVRLIWSWPTISSQTSQHDDIIALIWHNNIVDSETDHLDVYKVFKIIRVDLCAHMKLINVNTLCWFICIGMCTHIVCATHPATIIPSQTGKPTMKFDHQQRYRHGTSHDITIQKYPTIQALLDRIKCNSTAWFGLFRPRCK